MKSFIFFLVSLPLSAAVTNVTVETLSAQAVIRYTAPDSGRCSIAASPSAGLTPLVSDVDPAKFTSANGDSRFSFLDSGLNRTFVVGQKAAARGVDNFAYSRALANNTVYYFQITCGASQSPISSFTTRSAPLGLMFVDPVQADAASPGEMLSPWVNFSTRQFYVDPQTAFAFQPVTLPHDVTGVGANFSPHALTNAFIDKAGAGWGGANYPFTITNDASSALVLEAAGFQFWPDYPFDAHSASYSSDVMGNLNWTEIQITAQSSNSGCPALGTRCSITVCMSENRVTCDPWSNVLTQPVTNSSATYTFGNQDVKTQGGWIKPGYRPRNGPETADRTSLFGNITCNGTNTAVLPNGLATNLLWSNGTPVTINGVRHLISSVIDESTLALQDTCVAGTYSWSVTSLSWLVRVQAASADTITITGVSTQYEIGLSPSWPDAGYDTLTSKQTVNGAAGAPGYLFQAQTGLGTYWINAATGATSLIGTSLLNGQGLCFPGSAAWDTRPNTTIDYCVAGPQIYAETYTPTTWADAGNFDENNAVQCGSAPCWTQTSLTSGTSTDALLAAWDSTYPGTSKGMTCNSLVGMNSLNHLVLLCWSNNSSYGWLAAFDPLATSNSKAGNAGCVGAILGNSSPGCIIAGIPTYLRGGSLSAAGRGSPMKGDIRADSGPGIIIWQPQPNSGSLDGQGPWQIGATGGFAFSATVDAAGGPTTCPSNAFAVTGKNCTAVPIDGQPYDPNPGPHETGARGEYITIQPGDYLSSGLNPHAGFGQELVRVLAVNISSGTCGAFAAPCVWLQRGAARDSNYCTPPAPKYTCGFGAPPQSSSPDPTLIYAASSGNVFWDYLHDPSGQTLVQSYEFDSTDHRATFNGHDVDCCSINNSQLANSYPPCVDNANGCFGIKIDPAGNTWNLLSRSNPTFDGATPLFPQFNGVVASVGANPVQFHPSLAGTGGSADSRRYFQDGRPFNGEWSPGGQPCSATNIAGTLWKIAVGCAAGGPTSGLHRKIYPTKAQWGWHPLLDVSPSVIGTAAPDNYKYCVVNGAGDCRSGSAPGEIYFNVPWLKSPFCTFPGQASTGGDVSDICVFDNNPMLDTLIELPLDNPSDRGQKQRIITHMFAPSKVNAPFGNVDALPNNSWWVARTRSFASTRAEVLLIQRPPEVLDSIDRTQYAQPTITVPGAPGYAMIEWGYSEYGSDGQGVFNCTSRADNCHSGGSPFSFASETQTPASCSTGCAIQPSFIPDRVVFWRWLRTDALGNVTATGPTQVRSTR